eukprot:80859_1
MRLFKFYGDRISIECRKHLIAVLGDIILLRRHLSSKSKCNFVDKNQLKNVATKHTKHKPFTDNERALKSFYNMLCDSYVVYRTYASLHFLMLVDEGENMLAIMDLIHLYVELLDRKYTSVCEYDIVFDPQSAYFVLEELILDGLVSDINLDKLAKQMFE